MSASTSSGSRRAAPSAQGAPASNSTVGGPANFTITNNNVVNIAQTSHGDAVINAAGTDDERAHTAAKRRLGPNYNSRMARSLLTKTIGSERYEIVRGLAAGKSSREFYSSLLEPSRNVANSFHMDLFPLLPDVGLTANFYFFACVYRSIFHLENITSTETDRSVIEGGFTDKRYYETMKQRVAKLKSGMIKSSEPELVSELKRGLTISTAGKLEVNPKQSIVFPIGKTGKFEYRADAAILDRLRVPNEGQANYICHGRVLGLLLKASDRFVSNGDVKNLVSSIDTVGITKKDFKRVVKISHFAFLLATLICPPSEKDFFRFAQAIALYYKDAREYEKAWGGYTKHLFKNTVTESDNDAEFKRLKLEEDSESSDDEAENDSNDDQSEWSPEDDE